MQRDRHPRRAPSPRDRSAVPVGPVAPARLRRRWKGERAGLTAAFASHHSRAAPLQWSARLESRGFLGKSRLCCWGVGSSQQTRQAGPFVFLTDLTSCMQQQTENQGWVTVFISAVPHFFSYQSPQLSAFDCSIFGGSLFCTAEILDGDFVDVYYGDVMAEDRTERANPHVSAPSPICFSPFSPMIFQCDRAKVGPSSVGGRHPFLRCHRPLGQ